MKFIDEGLAVFRLAGEEEVRDAAGGEFDADEFQHRDELGEDQNFVPLGHEGFEGVEERFELRAGERKGVRGGGRKLSVGSGGGLVNGSVFQTITLASGSSQTLNFCFPTNSTYALVYTAGGFYPSEVGVNMTVNGTLVYNVVSW